MELPEDLQPKRSIRMKRPHSNGVIVGKSYLMIPFICLKRKI